MALPFKQETLVRTTLEEFPERVRAADLEDVAAIIWAIAAAKETYGFVNHTLTSVLISVSAFLIALVLILGFLYRC